MVDELRIENPCHESWEAMAGDARRRRCDACREHVHDLSAMRHDEARALVRAAGGSLCVRYRVAADGTVRFADLVPRADLTRRLVRTAVAATLLAACTPHGDHEPLHDPDAGTFTVHEPPATRVPGVMDPEVAPDPEEGPEPHCEPTVEPRQTPIQPPRQEPRHFMGKIVVDFESRAGETAARQAVAEAEERQRQLERQALAAGAATAR